MTDTPADPLQAHPASARSRSRRAQMFPSAAGTCRCSTRDIDEHAVARVASSTSPHGESRCAAPTFAASAPGTNDAGPLGDRPVQYAPLCYRGGISGRTSRLRLPPTTTSLVVMRPIDKVDVGHLA